jgi:hypothetical protein
MKKKWLIAGGAVLFVVALGVVTTLQVRGGSTAVLWTDRPEIVRYAEIFNAEQSDYRIEVQYKEAPAQALAEGGASPDIVIGDSLKSSSTRSLFLPLDYLFSTLRITPGAFYSSLLELGNLGGKQFLLPVSFNLPTIIYRRGTADLKSAFDVSLDELETLGKTYNKKQNDQYVRMGFSPRWKSDFLFIVAELYGASFREDKPLSWNQGDLDRAVDFTRNWVRDANENSGTEDDFQFKYLYNPEYKSVMDGRILFAYTESSQFFIIPEDKRSSLDFRWVSRGNSVPVLENILYLGICKRGKGRQAADSFVQWFYNENSQKKMLEESRQLQVNDSFGIAGGFSALRGVNDHVFPGYYPTLVGHLPPQEYIKAPRILPWRWTDIKENVILPWLGEAVTTPTDASGKPQIDSLSKRLEAWAKQNLIQ